MNNYQRQEPVVLDVSRAPGYSERQFLHTFKAGVTLPLMQALTTAVLIGIAVFVVVVVAFDAMDPFKPAGAVSLAVLVVTWLYLQRRWLSLTALERALGVDLNNDKAIGEVEPQKVRVQLEDVKENGHYHVDIVDLPGSPKKLALFAAGLLNGAACSEKQWTGKGLLFGMQEFRTLKSEMQRRGLLAYVNPREPRQGLELTKAGRAVMKRLAVLSPAPASETDENA